MGIIQTIRCFIFDIVYFAWTFLFSVAMIWILLLPKKIFIPLIKLYFKAIVLFEKIILGLNYKIIGFENIPKDGTFIIASKHQSTYETLKYFILFDRLSIIMKKELINLPFWGWYARKMGAVGVDRSDPRKAIKSLNEALNIVQENQANLLIFPQGTRVSPKSDTKDYPYKSGIYRMYKKMNVPVVPIALNSGVFWPKNSFLKRKGTVTFEILPSIGPGMDEKSFMHLIEHTIENAQQKLMIEQKAN